MTGEAVKGTVRRRILFLVAFCFIVPYLVISLTPLRAEIGRHSPALASWFSPPLMNFNEVYTSGEAGGLSIGMPRADVRPILEGPWRYSHIILGGCGGENLEQVIRLTHEAQVSEALARDALCLGSLADPTMLIVRFDADKIVSIEIVYTRIGMP